MNLFCRGFWVPWQWWGKPGAWAMCASLMCDFIHFYSLSCSHRPAFIISAFPCIDTDAVLDYYFLKICLLRVTVHCSQLPTVCMLASTQNHDWDAKQMQNDFWAVHRQICCSVSCCIIRMFIAALATLRHSLTSSLYFLADVNDDKVRLGWDQAAFSSRRYHGQQSYE